MRVLLVEDFTDAGRVIEAQLQNWKVHVTRSNNATGALRQIELSRRSGPGFDLLLLDWQDAQVDALRTLMRCLNNSDTARRLPLIALPTADSREAQNRAIGCARIDTVLVKPVLAAPLLGLLRKAMARRARPETYEAVRASPAAEGAAQSAALGLAARAASLSGARVLLVEDNAVNQIVAQRMLEHLGLEVELACDGVEALAALEVSGQRPFDAVLMDMHMPVLDGIATACIINGSQRWAGLPVIAMTAATMPEDQAMCLEAGMVGFLTKPVMAEVLLETLLRWIPRPGSAACAALMPLH
jgi:CheY-like chemotaxis protein